MADVTIKLSGEQYRTLCMEGEYHAIELKRLIKTLGGADRQAAVQRAAKFEFVMEAVRK